MPETQEENVVPPHVDYIRQARAFAMGEHPLSKYVPPLLLLLDALLTSAIISKVACKFPSFLLTHKGSLIVEMQTRKSIGKHTWSKWNKLSMVKEITRL
jgi:hypothetical protein